MTRQANPKLYVVQKKVMACSVEEAIKKSQDLPIDSVFPDAAPQHPTPADSIGFKTVDPRFPFEYDQ